MTLLKSLENEICKQCPFKGFAMVVNKMATSFVSQYSNPWETEVLLSLHEEQLSRAYVGDLLSFPYPEKFQGTGLLTGSLGFAFVLGVSFTELSSVHHTSGSLFLLLF